jgi:hypothetical protein
MVNKQQPRWPQQPIEVGIRIGEEGHIKVERHPRIIVIPFGLILSTLAS